MYTTFFQFAIVLVVKLVVLPRACETLPMLDWFIVIVLGWAVLSC